jgi:superfamily I DNA/RNA helicase
LTFSRAAVHELVQRSPAVLSGKYRDRVEVSTFHGFATSLLAAHRRYIGGGMERLTLSTEQEEALGLAAEGGVTYGELLPLTLDMFGEIGWLAAERDHRCELFGSGVNRV